MINGIFGKKIIPKRFLLGMTKIKPNVQPVWVGAFCGLKIKRVMNVAVVVEIAKIGRA